MNSPVRLDDWTRGQAFRSGDRDEIATLMYRFVMAMDFGEKDVFASCVTDPLVWDLTGNDFPLSGGPADDGPVEVTPSEFVEIALRSRDDGGSNYMQHDISNPFVVFTGEDSAELLAYVQMRQYHYGADASGTPVGQQLLLSGYYHNSLQRDGGDWRIHVLRLKMKGYDPAVLAAAHANQTSGQI